MTNLIDLIEFDRPRVRRVYRVNQYTNEKVLVGYLSKDNAVKLFAESLCDIDFYPAWYYQICYPVKGESTIESGEFIEFVPNEM